MGTHCMQAQVTDLVLQRFQSAELADLPALLCFLLQHVNSQNASQVIAHQQHMTQTVPGRVLT